MLTYGYVYGVYVWLGLWMYWMRYSSVMNIIDEYIMRAVLIVVMLLPVYMIYLLFRDK